VLEQHAEPHADGAIAEGTGCGSKHKSGQAGQSFSIVELAVCGAFAVAAKRSTNTIPMSQRTSPWEM